MSASFANQQLMSNQPGRPITDINEVNTTRMARLVRILDDWSIQTRTGPKRMDGKFVERFTWRASKAYLPNQNRVLESAWEGFATAEEMLDDMLRTLDADV